MRSELVTFYRVYTIERGLMIASSITDENFNSEFKTIEEARQAIINNGVYDEYVILPITELRVKA